MQTLTPLQAREVFGNLPNRLSRVQIGIQPPQLLHTDWPETFGDSLSALEQSFGWQDIVFVDRQQVAECLRQREPLHIEFPEVQPFLNEWDDVKRMLIEGAIDAMRERYGSFPMALESLDSSDHELCSAHRDLAAVTYVADHIARVGHQLETIAYSHYVNRVQLTQEGVRQNCGDTFKLLGRDRAVLSSLIRK